MGKRERTVNPADALRKKQRKVQLKKNKEDKKKGQLIALSQKNTGKLETEYRVLMEQDHAGTLDSNGKLRVRQIQDQMATINAARTELGLAPKVLRANAHVKPGSGSLAAKSDVTHKYYHPTFNPHGKRKGEVSADNDAEEEDDDEEDEEDEDDDEDNEDDEDDDSDEENDLDGQLENDDQEQETVPEPVIRDLSHIPIPSGIPPETEGQTYFALDLPEILSPSEAERRNQEQKRQLEEKEEKERLQRQEKEAVAAAVQGPPGYMPPAQMPFPGHPHPTQMAFPGHPHPMQMPYPPPMMAMPHPGQLPMHIPYPAPGPGPGQMPMHSQPFPGFYPGYPPQQVYPGMQAPSAQYPGYPPQAEQHIPRQPLSWAHAAASYATESFNAAMQPMHQSHMQPTYPLHQQRMHHPSGHRPPRPLGQHHHHRQSQYPSQRPTTHPQQQQSSSSSSQATYQSRKPATSAVISAEPQIRDLRKELTQFVPTALLRKRAPVAGGSSKPSGSSGASK